MADARTLGTAYALGVHAIALSGDIRQTLADAGSGRGAARALIALSNTQVIIWMRQALAQVRGCDAIVTAGLAAFVGLSLGEYLKVPVIGAGMIPLTPSREFPSPFLPRSWVPASFNRASLALTNQLLWMALKKALNRARGEVLGLSTRTTLWVDHPMIYGISPTLLPRPRDWPGNAVLCGQWELANADGYAAPADLLRFLADGPPPIYMGFGSMTAIDMHALLTTTITALAGRRALFWPGWNDMVQMELPANILRIDAAPHSWLFPQVAAVIHHGGSGTAHSATRAGKPSIVIPFTGDQPFWADRLHRLGVAPPGLSAAHPDAKAFAAALDFVSQGAVVARAAELGQRMAQEEGLMRAVAVIERELAQDTRPRSALP